MRLVCVCTHLQKKYPKMVFSHSTLHLGRVELFTSSLKLKNNSTTPSTPLTHTCTTYILITNFFGKREFWTRKFWQFSYNLPNLPKFSPSKILYHTVLAIRDRMLFMTQSLYTIFDSSGYYDSFNCCSLHGQIEGITVVICHNVSSWYIVIELW